MGESLGGIKTILAMMECMVEKDSLGELQSDIDFHYAMKELISVVRERVAELTKGE